ncbi:MAG: hypothetical protein EA426_17365 [Spirochaetaceae bacterium]|nr:MAG: hypothetical protein EA426_17365 [Spirochaetaceae bacterium]
MRTHDTVFMTILFYSRMALYLLAFLVPVVHPAIAVPYDLPGWVLWFVLLPAEMFIAFYGAPPRLRISVWLAIGAAPIVITALAFGGFSRDILSFLAVGGASFIVTAVVFKSGVRGLALAVPEQFLLAVLYYRVLSFSRAAESVARESAGINQILLAVVVVAFLLHGFVLYLAAFKSGARRGRREATLVTAVALAVVLIFAFVLPPDFVNNPVVLNFLENEVEPEPVPIDARGDGMDGGNLQPRDPRANGDLFGDGADGADGDDGDNGENGAQLEGVAAESWDGTGNNNGSNGEDRQYAVMVMASREDSVYAADAYFADFDPVRGFRLSRDEPLNELTYVRLLETWRDTTVLPDRSRARSETFILSTVPERFVAYRPYSIEPTTLRREYHPFSFSYTASARVSRGTERTWQSVRELSETERERLAPYLEIPLRDADRAVFEEFLAEATEGRTGYYAKLDGIMRAFSTFQYNVGFDENTSVPHMVRFLTTTQEGDCTEFSNTTAILARLAGMPARVVTGYLGSRSLQTAAHTQGLAVLRQSIPTLQQYALDDLLLVTTSHRHSWTQVYMPEYGWIDFEPTSFAIPPVGMGDPNQRNVVIPLLDPQPEPYTRPAFPWGFVLRVFALLAAAAFVGAYTTRYGQEIYFAIRARRHDLGGARALYRLLILRYAANGAPLKAPSTTPREFAEQHPETATFASIYSEIRYREKFKPDELETLHTRLRTEYGSLRRAIRANGIKAAFKRVVTLRGLGFQW